MSDHVGHLVVEVKRGWKLVASYEPPLGPPFGYTRKHPVICCSLHQRMTLGEASNGTDLRRVIPIVVDGTCPEDCGYRSASEGENA